MGLLERIFGPPKRLPLHIHEDNFATEVLRSKVPVVIDIWAPNQRASKQLEPIMVRLATDYHERVKVCELNAVSAPRAAARLKVRDLPTVVYLRPRGREADRVVGLRSSLYHEEAIAELFEIPKRPNDEQS